MKKIILTLAISSFSLGFAQQKLSINSITGFQSAFDDLKNRMGKSLNFDEVEGSPYLNKKFTNAKVATNYQEASVRYNSYSDEIEFQKGDEVQVLPKSPTFSRVEFTAPAQVMVLLETSDDLSGYFIELVNGKNSLYKKIKTEFVDASPATKGYTDKKPASFNQLDPVYYIKTEKGFIKKPKHQKDIQNEFPDKQEVLNAFFKSNKIKFDKEESLIKLVNFLNRS
ncbi:hypothetical protein [Chryseobacterium bernardetii]|uniref:hypothetical protein n=1 Tax=Chryseobacterium bernardetii TaxID=1241978 RepID=UPI0030175349